MVISNSKETKLLLYIYICFIAFPDIVAQKLCLYWRLISVEFMYLMFVIYLFIIFYQSQKEGWFLYKRVEV